jgi:hypothetical protein
MSSGGARARSGPPPDPDALRRSRPSDQASWTTLPSAGRAGPPPAWPLTRATRRELARWAIEWAKPQAVMWEAEHQADQVAQYVRAFVEAERRGSSVTLRTHVKQLEEILGLSLSGLARNRWRISDAAAAAADPRRPAATGGGARARLTAMGVGVVDGA